MKPPAFPASDGQLGLGEQTTHSVAGAAAGASAKVSPSISDAFKQFFEALPRRDAVLARIADLTRPKDANLGLDLSDVSEASTPSSSLPAMSNRSKAAILIALLVAFALARNADGGSTPVRSAAYEKGYGEGQYCEQWGGSQSFCVDDCQGDAYRLYRSDSDIWAYENGCSAGWKASYGG